MFRNAVVGLNAAGHDEAHAGLSSSSGGTTVNSDSTPTVPIQARRSSRHADDTARPIETEKNSVFISTSTSRQNSPTVTPPMTNGMASGGKMASNP